jgi:dimeric dUTPase (all-alpha-NTP-PPase superfamily)
MNLTRLFKAQKFLDDGIIEKHSLHGQDLTSNKILALLVEIGELANETRCFKHWSLKGPSEDSVILEEFVDGVHFFISLAINLGISPENFIVTEDYTKEDINSSFLELYRMVSNLGQTDIKAELHAAFSLFIGIAEIHLGFTWNDIEQGYFRKNAINLKRQEEGY